MDFKNAFNRTAALSLLAKLNGLDNEAIAKAIGEDGNGNKITVKHVEVYLSDPSFPIPKHFLVRLTNVKQMQELLEMSDQAVADLAKMDVMYVKYWTAAKKPLPAPDGLLIKMLHLYQARADQVNAEVELLGDAS